MAELPKPAKPLRILTIDGCGFQGISSLIILDRLLKKIAQSSGVPNHVKLRPCDVFDVIAGIGPGGWLALLLGRFQMDVLGAMAEWYNLVDHMAPRSTVEEIRMRLWERISFDTDLLVGAIGKLAEFHETDEYMFFTPPEGTRCRHVFVSAIKTDSKDRHLGYNLFRTYDCPEGAKVLDGPSDPRKYKTSHAFAATGAAKYFTHPWKETSGANVESRFLDTQFPSPHNITELALDEMWGLYGTDLDISIVINVGPGVLNAADHKVIASRFSWGNSSAGGVHSESSLSCRKTPGSGQNSNIEEKLKREQNKIEDDVRRKLENGYQTKPPPYYRLAPQVSAARTAYNNTSAQPASEAAEKYLLELQIMGEIVQTVAFDTGDLLLAS